MKPVSIAIILFVCVCSKQFCFLCCYSLLKGVNCANNQCSLVVGKLSDALDQSTLFTGSHKIQMCETDQLYIVHVSLMLQIRACHSQGHIRYKCVKLITFIKKMQGVNNADNLKFS